MKGRKFDSWRVIEKLRLHEPQVYQYASDASTKAVALAVFARLTSPARETRVINPLEED